MIREKFLRTSKLSAYPEKRLRTYREAIEELRRPCGRFTYQMPLEESLRTFITSKTAMLDFLGDSFLIDSAIPLNWQRLLRYLHEARITGAMFVDRYQRNDFPSLYYNFELDSLEDYYLADGRKVRANGFGASFDREEALSKAVGETLERYFLSAYDRESFHCASYADLSRSNNVLDIFQFDFFHDWQRKKNPAYAFDEASPFHWVEGYDLRTGASIYLPAQIVYWSYQHSPRGRSSEKIIFSQTTSGSAGHFTRDEATLAALLEAIQRDAFLIYWLNSLTPKVIDLETIEHTKIRSLVDEIRRFKFEPIFLNTTSDMGVPTATCVLHDMSDPANPIYAVGSSTGFTLEDTLIPGLIEALSVLHFVSLQDQYMLPEPYEPFTSQTLSRSERLRAWRGAKMAERIHFFISGEKQSAHEFIRTAPEINTTERRLAYVRAMCEARGKGYEIYIFEVQNKILSSLGYHVVRAIVPQLIPLYLLESAAPLKARRLRDVPERIGYKAAMDFNPWPHPFP